METKPTPEQLERADTLYRDHRTTGWAGTDIPAALVAAILAADQQQAELLRALEPFALVAEHDIGEDEADHDLHRHMDKHNRAPRLTVGDFRRAFREWQGGRSDG